MDKESLIASMLERGWYTTDAFLDHTQCQNLVNELKKLPLREAKVGRGTDLNRQEEIRNDSIYWLEQNASVAQDEYLEKMEELMAVINRELYLGIRQFEGHFARYEKGHFYKKHSDQFSGNKDRVISTITYLNTPTSGGELRVYNKNNNELIDAEIKPSEGRLVCFLSSQIYHEVLPANDERYSIAGWFRTNIT